MTPSTLPSTFLLMTEHRIHISGPTNIARPESSNIAAENLGKLFPKVDYALRYSGEGELTYPDGQTLLSFTYDTETGAVAIPDIEAAAEKVADVLDHITDEERELEDQIQALKLKLRQKGDEAITVRRVLRSLYVLEASGHGA